jgi:L-ascorbate metabolism protein UlaG (beta-lactamase superfamily)
MDPQGAAFATNRFLVPKFAIPMHYGTYPILAGRPDEYIKALGNTKTRVIALQPGEKVEF